MHFKLFLAFALASVCAGRTILGYEKVWVNVDYDTMWIKNTQGQEVKIFANKVAKPFIHVLITSPSGYTKTFKVDEIKAGYGSQSDILYQIFKQYEGELDQTTCMDLLTTLEKYVQLNEISPIVLLVIRSLCYQDQSIYSLLDQDSQGFGGYYGPYSNAYKGLWSSRPHGSSYMSLYGPYASQMLNTYSRVFGRDYPSNTYGYEYSKTWWPMSSSWRLYGGYGDLHNKMYGDFYTTGYYHPYSSVYSSYYGPYTSQSNSGYYGGLYGKSWNFYGRAAPSYLGKTRYGQGYSQQYPNLVGGVMY